MTLTKFTDIPPYFLVSLFQDWISVEEFCDLDSAFCNKFQRPRLHHILRITNETNLSSETFKVTVIVASTLRCSSLRKYVVSFQYEDGSDLTKYLNQMDSHQMLFNCVLWNARFSIRELCRPVEKKRMVRNSRGLKFFSASQNFETAGGYGCSIGNFDYARMGWFDCDQRLSGFGELKRPATHYKGNWLHGERSGMGTEISSKWNQQLFIKYKGEYQYNEMTGKGTLIYQNGDIYTGDLCRGYRHGFGTFTTTKNGQVKVGQWVQNNFTEIST
jgi:hypothetical protein